MLPFLVASIIFALIGTGVRGIIRPISWATLGIATLVAGYGGLPNLFSSTIAPSNSTLPAPPAPNFTTSSSTGTSPSPAASSPITTSPPATTPATSPNPAGVNTGWEAMTPRLDPAATMPATGSVASNPPATDPNALPPRVSQPSAATNPTVAPPDRVVQNPATTGAVTGLW